LSRRHAGGVLSRSQQPPAEPAGHHLTRPRGAARSGDRTSRPTAHPNPTHHHTLVKERCEMIPSHIHPQGCSMLLDWASPGAT
jgi:hypothetical protein